MIGVSSRYREVKLVLEGEAMVSWEGERPKSQKRKNNSCLPSYSSVKTKNGCSRGSSFEFT